MASSYRPRVRPSLAAMTAMILAAIGAVLVLSISWPMLGAVGRLAFVGTLLPALLIAALLTWICKRSHFAWPKSAAAIAAIATLLAILGPHYGAHRQYAEDTRAEAEYLLTLRTGLGGEDLAVLEQDHQRSISTLSFRDHFARHFGFRGEPQDGAAGMWGPVVGLGIYLLEVVVALMFAAYYPAGAASEPTCAKCGRWSRERLLGTAAFGVTSEFTDALLSGHGTARAAELLVKPDTKEQLELSLATCPEGHDDEHGVLRLRESYYDKRSRHLLKRHRQDLRLTESEQGEVCARLGAWS